MDVCRAAAIGNAVAVLAVGIALVALPRLMPAAVVGLVVIGVVCAAFAIVEWWLSRPIRRTA